jgi:hypothetical protein
MLDKLEIRSFFRNPRSIESFVWIMFVILFSIVASNAQGNDGYAFDMANDIRGFYSGFMNVNQLSDWWDFMGKDFANVTYQTKWYNGDPVDANEQALANLEFVIVGIISVRQLRVRNDSCPVRYIFNVTTPGCFAEYNSGSEDRQSYGPVLNATGAPSYRYRTSQELGCTLGCYFSGMLGTYPISGFSEDLPAPAGNSSYADALARLNDLSAGRWIDRHTRAVFVELTLYSVAADVLASVSMSLETPVAGGVVPFITVLTMRMENLFPTARNGGPLAAEGILLLLLLAYTALAVREWRAKGTAQYWAGGWAVVDWANYLLLYAAFGVRYGAFVSAHAIKFPPGPTDRAYYGNAGGLVELWKNLLGVNAVLTYFKVIDRWP